MLFLVILIAYLFISVQIVALVNMTNLVLSVHAEEGVKMTI